VITVKIDSEPAARKWAVSRADDHKSNPSAGTELGRYDRLDAAVTAAVYICEHESLLDPPAPALSESNDVPDADVTLTVTGLRKLWKAGVYDARNRGERPTVAISAGAFSQPGDAFYWAVGI
jgi:hypothetical protein